MSSATGGHVTQHPGNLAAATSGDTSAILITSTLAANGRDACLSQRYWSYFLASSLITFFSGLIAILSCKLLHHFYHSSGRRRLPPMAKETEQGVPGYYSRTQVGVMTRLKWYAEECISGQTFPGRIFVSLSCGLSIGSLIIYLIDASSLQNQEETCIPWKDSLSQQFDLVFNIFFMVFFFIRLVAANDKLTFWLEIHSFVDYFTIPPAFVGIYLNRQWLGLRFLRALRLMSFPDILQYLSILRTSNTIRLAQLVCIFLSVWLAASGFIHLVESSGDPFFDFINEQELTYWQCVYIVIVTMSTVGYGDLVCETTIGRAFMVVFILGALAMFASFVPEIMDIVGRRERYRGVYDKPVGVRHIIICGHITYESVQNFLRDFLHEDRENQNVKCVFLDSKTPDLEVEALFKRHFTQVAFFKGTIMSTRDLERVKLPESDSVLIMANPRCRDPDAEDAANIMRVISVKNFHQDIRCIVQLMRYHNKSFLVNLPSWSQHHDQVICLAEMKLGFLAQSCLAPGFSTLMANLFVMRAYKKSTKCLQWQDHYLRGAGMEMYTEHFSRAFHGQPFPQVAEFCFTRLKLLLVGVTIRVESDYSSQIMLNPGSDVIIETETKGFFICQSEDEVKRVLFYCPVCHGQYRDETIIRPCVCSASGKFMQSINGGIQTDDDDFGFVIDSPEEDRKNSFSNGASAPSLPRLTAEEQLELERRKSEDIENIICQAQSLKLQTERQGYEGTPSPDGKPDGTLEFLPADEQFDSTGLFHWCPVRPFNDVILSHDRNRDVLKRLRHHVVVCLFADDKSPLVGLCNFVMPLRSSALRHSELKTIVIVGNEEYLMHEWPAVKHFPEIYVKPGSSLNRADLRAVKINQCHMCVILSANDPTTDDPTLVDKEAILCSLNIKTMTFQNLTDIWKSSPQRALMTLALLRNRENIHGKVTHRPTTGACIAMVTELANDYNVQFLDQDDEDDPETPLYMTQPFACGRAFAASVLDSLMSTAFFNDDALRVIRLLLTGGATPELEQILAEGVGLVRGTMSAEMYRARHRCRVGMLPLEDGVLSGFSNSTFGSLFVGCLRTLGILCLGIYRQIDPRPSAGSFYRYVITNPPPDFDLYPSDKIYILQPFVFGEGVPPTYRRQSTRL